MKSLFRRASDALTGPLGGLKLSVSAASVLMLAGLGGSLIVPGARGFACLLAIGYVILLLTGIVFLVSRLFAKINDIQAEIALQSELARREYPLQDFFTQGAAANASFQLFLVKCLHICRPRAILELGSGQTTKILACHHVESPESRILVLEDDQAWARLMSAQLRAICTGVDYRHCPLQKREFACEGTSLRITTRWYVPPPELRTSRFDLIIVDGPSEGGDYSRSGVLEYVPHILADSWVIVFDDAERYGERMTVKVFRSMLHSAGREYCCFELHGAKTQAVFCSPDFRYLRSC